ncbi:MAG: hypothetical protein J1F18_08405 [Lachnospiraceae bacterium]|nr:hypothetical protein [Lachnospiraceae bacterium]
MDNYTKWLEKEQAWIEEVDRKTRSMTLKYCGLMIVGCVVVLGAIGLFAGETMDVAAMLQNMLIGLIFGVVVALLTFFLTGKPSKHYMKWQKEGVEALTPGEREEMATQMLSPDVICINHAGTDKTEKRILISQNYLISSSTRGEFTLVNLKQLDRIETDLRDTSYIVRTRGMRMSVNDAVFVILFYYKKISDGKNQDADAVCVFPDRVTRDEVVRYIQERTAENY